jgi:hypothetical protein
MRSVVNWAQEKVRTSERRQLLNRVVSVFLPSRFAPNLQSAPFLTDLETQGNVRLPNLFPSSKLINLRRQLEDRECFDPWNAGAGGFKMEDTPIETNNARIQGVAKIKESLEIANDPFILNIVSQYLGCKPTIDDIVAWWSLPGRSVPKEEQFYHRDNDAIRFVKLFLYLSDVRDHDGAHMFVMGSHRENILLKRRKRYLDSEVEAAFPKARIRAMTGDMGTTFLEDTFGLHRGGVPSNVPRLLFQVRYTSYPSVFARRNKVFREDLAFDPYVNRYVS